MGTAHFRITGESLTQIARNLFLEDQPTKAWRVISEGLRSDDPNAQAVIERAARRILDGVEKLTGNETDGIEIAPDKATSYIQETQYLYAGRIQVEGRWWRPRAIVTDLGPHNKTGRVPKLLDSTGFEKWSKGRVEFHADADERVYPCKEGWLIFEPVSEPPYWWKSPTTIEAALQELRDHKRRLDEESWSKRPGSRITDDDADAEDRAWVEKHEAECADLRRRILEQAGTETIELRDEDGKVVATVPRAPFLSWSLNRHPSLRHMAPWEPVSKPGMKLLNDDPRHSDWYIGAGFTFAERYDYNGPIHKAAFNTMYELFRTIGRFECAVITHGACVSGTVGSEILVVPDLHPDRLEAMLRAKAVVTEAGGELAHLANVARERSIPILLCPGAMVKFPVGVEVFVDPTNGLVELDQTRV